MRDYRAWHDDYDDPQSSLSQRLAVVQRRLAERVSAMPPGAIQIISMCAGQGRDVIPILQQHSRAPETRAALLEIDPRNVALAKRAIAASGLTGVTAIQTDASISDAYAAWIPADILLACGIFGNISDADLEHTVRSLSMLCRQGATVIWTRHWKQPQMIVAIRQWFHESGFLDLGFDALDNERKMGVGVVSLTGTPLPFKAGVRFFTFLR